MNEIDELSARDLIQHLKAGTTPLDLVRHINVGNERWYGGCGRYFEQVERNGKSTLRFIKGYVGDGKTHFMGMLRVLANDRNWAVGYVSAEHVPFSRYDLVLLATIKNLVIPSALPVVPWLAASPRGASRLFAALFSKYYLKAYGKSDAGGIIPVYDEVKERVDKILGALSIHEILASAARAYVHAVLNEDKQGIRDIPAWLEGQPVDVKAYGIKKKIDETLARDCLRGLSVLAKAAGLNGVLVLLDEAERILDRQRPVRLKSYGVIRDLLDDADGQGGMPSSIFYVAATPDMFTKTEGFTDYEALQSRLSSSEKFAIPNFVDWRGVIVDLTLTPLGRAQMVELAHKIRSIHGIAEGWAPETVVSDALIAAVVSRVEAGAFQVSKLRMLASSVAVLTDMAQQNPDQELEPLIGHVFQKVAKTLATASEKADDWD